MRRCTAEAITVVLLAAAALIPSAAAADGAAGRGGGLVPSPHKTREELVRSWDLNRDGTIDKGEAEMAASRMRRERAALRLNSGIDPVTGRPRDEAVDGVVLDDADMAVEPSEPVEDPADEPEPDAGPVLPGTRVPRPRPPTSVTDAARAASTTGGARPPEPGSRSAADRRPVTGGVRAGGLPARAGYGAGVPAAPLNAGLPIPARQSPAVRQPPQQPRGGLVPAPRPAPPLLPRPAASRDLYDPR